MKILVTGGAGYIGSHICLELFNEGYTPIIVDNFSTSNEKNIVYLKQISKTHINIENVDICDNKALENVFRKHDNIDAIIHCAGLKSVPESILNPLEYFSVNVSGSINLLQLSQKYKVGKFIFSSSASVYGESSISPLSEETELKPNHPYAESKAIIEKILKRFIQVNKDYSSVVLRYFNPIGSHPSGELNSNEKHDNLNLMSYLLKTVKGDQPFLEIYGYDYDSNDGTAVRDFVHVVDLAKAHVKSLKYLEHNQGYSIFNIGTGTGVSVLDLVKAFEEVNNIHIPIEFCERRKGDIGISYASVDKATTILGWKAQKNLKEMCRDSWNRVKS